MATRAPKRRKLTPPGSDDEEARGTTNISKAFMKNAATWDLEQDYENRRRLLAKKGKKESQRLPFKTPDGRLQQAIYANDEVVSDLDDEEEWPEEEEAKSPSQAEVIVEEPSVPESQLIHEAKEELAKIAVALNEEPEENMGAFKALAKIGESRILAIQKLTIATQMAVYKDVIPGYRIRPHTEEAKGEKVSKDTRKLWAYEQALVSGYQAYVKELTRLAKLDPAAQQPKGKGKGRGQTINNLAIACACTLLTSAPHFNFRSELLRILVNKLSRRPAGADKDFDRCIAALQTLFADDDDGTPSFDAVSLLSKMMRARDYRVDERVLNLFLRLQLLAGFVGKASHDRVDKPGDGGAEGGQVGKRPKQKREFRNKRVRKEMREQKKLEQDMALADASVGHEERDRMQSETLKLVFATYFRVLKLRVPHLMGAVLEGLARYAHLINQDFFGDLLEALKDLVRQSEGGGPEEQQQQQESNGIDAETGTDAAEDVVRDTSREALLCTVTAFTLLAGQDAHNARSTLHLDLTFFTQHLYQSLLSICTAPDLEVTSRSLRLDPDNPASQTQTTTATNRVNLHTTTVLLLRCLTSVLLPTWNARSVPPLRLAAFAKQILTAALHLPDKSAQASLALLDDVARAHGPKIAALWNTEERRADGAFNPLAASAEASNPFAATVWEGELLRRHFSPKVREGVRLLERSIGG